MERWFVERTAGAPERLREAAAAWWGNTPGLALSPRLTQAGQRALESAIAAGATRDAALDLLAADALITLALLAEAEANPTALASTAARHRAEVTPT